MKDCEICPFLVGQTADDDNVVMQTDHWVVILDSNQPYLGKSFVTARRHVPTITELNAHEWSELHDVMQKMERAIKSAFGADVINWECLMNNAIKAGQPTHVHWHLYPRYLGGVEFAGEYFDDPKWPRHLESAQHSVDDELFRQIITAIRTVIR